MDEQRQDGALSASAAAEVNPAPGKKKFRLQKSGKARKFTALALVAAVGGSILLHSLQNNQAAATVTAYQSAAVERRTIINSLSGSGTLQPADSYTVTTLVSGEILTDTFEEGDLVESGALLYTMDSSNAANSQTQAQNTYSQALKAKYPTAEISGIVSSVYVKNGDSVSSGTELCRIVADNKIYVDLFFTYADTASFYAGQPAALFISGFEGSVSATVEKVSSSTTTSSNGLVMTTVRVTAENPGLVTTDDTASAVVGDYTSYGNAPVNLSSARVVTASGSGTVTGLNLLAGDSISAGDRICTLNGDSIDNQLENALLSLDNAQDTLDNYKVTAPISGTVVTKSAKAGDKVEGGSSGTLCTIYDMSYLEMTMNIDELDIGNVAVGQTVDVVADAVEGRTYTGVVTKLSVAGNTSGGITTYPVTVRIDETDGLLPGMNVDAEIVLSSAENALAIPSGAVNRGNTVLVTADSPSAANALDREAPEGYVYVQVETGVSDDSYIEILSGLQEGDTAAYLPSTSGGDAFVMQSGMMGGAVMAAPSGGSGMPGGGAR